MNIFEAKKEKKKSTTTSIGKLRRLLKKGDVRFKYTKKDGTLRKAYGTLKPSLIPDLDKEDDRMEKKNKDVFYYYDLDKEDWRCFLKSNFKEITTEK